jgi:APA family basic amino acid/polyamine antiporter
LHPVVGYLYAWTALLVGFSAPIALAAMAMVYYMKPFISPQYGNVLAIVIITLVSIFHSFSVRQSGVINNILTLIKIIFAVGLILTGFITPAEATNSIDTTSPWLHELLLPGFAVSLIYVSYAYTGWNAAAYIVEEIDSPTRNLPKALISGTALVTILYILLQVVFLKHGRPEQLSGQVDVAIISFGNLFDGKLVSWISLLISIQLISTISGYAWIGPRITAAMAKEFHLWKYFATTNRNNIPVRALWLTTAFSILLVFTGSFEQILLYAGLVLQLMGTLTIGGALLIKTSAGTFKAPARPWLHLIYLVFSGWIIMYTIYERPFESLIGLSVIALGLILYLFDRNVGVNQNRSCENQ